MANTQITISAQDRFSQVFSRAQKELAQIEQVAGKVGGALGSLGGAIGVFGSLSLGGAVAGVVSLVGALDDLDEAAAGLGVTAVELSAFRANAQSAGVSAEEFGTALNQLNRLIGEAAGGGKQAQSVFASMGVSIRDQTGQLRSTSDVLRDVADRFASYRDGTLKSALAMEVFRGSGAKLIALLNEGREGLTKFGGASEEQIKSAVRLQRQLDNLSAAWGRLKLATGGFVAGAVVGVELPVAKEIEALEIKLRRLEENLANPRFRKNPELFERIRQEATATRAQLEGLRTAADDVGKGGGGDGKSEAPVVKTLAGIGGAAANARRELDLLRIASEGSAGQFREAQRIRENRRRGEEDADAANRAAEDQRQRRIDDIFGVTEARETSEILAIINREAREGGRTAEEVEAAWDRAFGKPMQDKLGETGRAAEQLSLAFASSLGRVIEGGGDAGDVFKALLQDITKLITQLVIVEPLAREIKEIFTSAGGSGGGSWLQAFLSIFGGAVSGGGGGWTGGGTATGGGGGGSFGGGGYAANIGARPLTISFDYSGMSIGAGVSRAEVASAMVQTKDMAIQEIQNQVARGRLRLQ